jgi:hypothetical protein
LPETNFLTYTHYTKITFKLVFQPLGGGVESNLSNQLCNITICSVPQTECICYNEEIQQKNGFGENFSIEKVKF